MAVEINILPVWTKILFRVNTWSILPMTSDDAESRHFRINIPKYNASFNMASSSAKVAKQFTSGVQPFRINGVPHQSAWQFVYGNENEKKIVCEHYSTHLVELSTPFWIHCCADSIVSGVPSPRTTCPPLVHKFMCLMVQLKSRRGWGWSGGTTWRGSWWRPWATCCARRTPSWPFLCELLILTCKTSFCASPVEPNLSSDCFWFLKHMNFAYNRSIWVMLEVMVGRSAWKCMRIPNSGSICSRQEALQHRFGFRGCCFYSWRGSSGVQSVASVPCHTAQLTKNAPPQHPNRI